MKATLARGGEHRDDMLVVFGDGALDAALIEARVLREIKHPRTGASLDVRTDYYFAVYKLSGIRLPASFAPDPEDGFSSLCELCCSASIIDLSEGTVLPHPKRTEHEKLRVTEDFWLLEFSLKHDDGYTYETEPNWWAHDRDQDTEAG